MSPWSLRALAWSTIAISAAQAQYIIDDLSFGHKEGSISPNLRAIPGWDVSGEGYKPDLLSDRVIITPPYPGNKRGALWSENPVQHSEWQAELHFRASGPERGSGNLQIWYAKDGRREVGLSSLYTTRRFDGLVLVLDQYGGRGGTIRGFLNDGSASYMDHHNVDSLSFGQCNYPYRNLGRFSVLQLKQAADYFQVTVDGNPCFRSDKVRLSTSIICIGRSNGLSRSNSQLATILASPLLQQRLPIPSKLINSSCPPPTPTRAKRSTASRLRNRWSSHPSSGSSSSNNNNPPQTIFPKSCKTRWLPPSVPNKTSSLICTIVCKS